MIYLIANFHKAVQKEQIRHSLTSAAA